MVTDLGEAPDALAFCAGGLRNLGVEEVVVGVCLRLHEVRGLGENIRGLLQPDLDRWQTALQRHGYTVTTELLLGEPRVEVANLAESAQCDAVVIGSRVHSLAGEVFLGSVAGEILHYCPRPLLVMRQQGDGEAPTCPLATLDRVLFPTDFSDNAEHAFLLLCRMVEQGLRSVVLLHVQDRTRIGRHLEGRLAEFNEIDRNRLERQRDVLLGKGAAEVMIELPYGLPKEEILRRTRQGDLSLVLMGSQGHGFLREVFLGSTSHSIARLAPAPVLLIPALR